MKFIHCADLHIDSKLESCLSPSAAKERREELLASFLRLAEKAKELSVRAVIIAGDLFDSERVSARSRKFVLNTILKYPEVDFLLLSGNHDREIQFLADSSELPQNLKLFSSPVTSFDYENVRIAGGAEYTDGMFSSCFDADMINIAVLHGENRTDFSFDTMKDQNIDYLALGHYHSYSYGNLDNRGAYCYSGCLEGRGFDECGDKGFVIIECDGKVLTHTFVPFAVRRVEEIDVDMSEGYTLADQARLLELGVENISRTSMLKVNIVGTYEPEREKFYDHIAAEYREKFFCFKLYDRSILYIDPASYINDISLKGEFIRLAMQEIEDEEERSRVIMCGLRALAEEEME